MPNLRFANIKSGLRELRPGFPAEDQQSKKSEACLMEDNGAVIQAEENGMEIENENGSAKGPISNRDGGERKEMKGKEGCGKVKDTISTGDQHTNGKGSKDGKKWRQREPSTPTVERPTRERKSIDTISAGDQHANGKGIKDGKKWRQREPSTSTVERPARERKSIDRFVVSAEKEVKEFKIEKGAGTALKDIPNSKSLATSSSFSKASCFLTLVNELSQTKD